MLKNFKLSFFITAREIILKSISKLIFKKKCFLNKNLKLKNDRSKLAESPLAQPLAQLKAFFMTDRSAARSAREFFAVDRSSARSAQHFFCENRNPA
jgi:hypothetical protein